MSYAIHGVELGQNAPPAMDPDSNTSTGSGSDWSDMLAQTAQGIATGLAQGGTQALVNLTRPKPVAPPPPSALQYVIPVLALTAVVGGTIYVASKKKAA